MEKNRITLHNLTKSYGEKIAVNIPSLSIQPQTFTCIVGKSGCGKTTLLRLLAGLERPDTEQDGSGIKNAGHPGRTEKFVAAGITGLPKETAPVFQEPRLMPWLTVKENIMFSLKGQEGKTDRQHVSASDATKTTAAKEAPHGNNKIPFAPGSAAHVQPSLSPEERCRRLLHELELTDAAGLYPAQLSGGMAQRVSLGRTLFYDPELILMDEPFSALDYFTRRNLQDMVLRLFRNQTKTILFVTHDVEEALLLGDRILVMENGAIKADLPVPFPFPRKAADSEIQKMRQAILDLLA